MKINRFYRDWGIEDLPRHPVAAYFGGDLQLAWVGPADAAEARTIIWPEKKLYGVIYGASDRLRTILERLGYSDNHRGNDYFTGARLKHIRIDHRRIVMPYLDGVGSLQYDPTDKNIYIGRSRRTKGVVQLGGGGTEGYSNFDDPDNRYCAVSNRIIKEGEETVTITGGGIALKSAAIANQYFRTTAGIFVRNPIVLVATDGSETIHESNFNIPRGYIRDNFTPRVARYILRTDAVMLNDDGHTHRLNIPRLVAGVRPNRYYTSLGQFYTCTGHDRKIVSHDLTAEQYDHMRVRAARNWDISLEKLHLDHNRVFNNLAAEYK